EDVGFLEAVNELKNHNKAKIPGTFDGVDAKELALWRVSILDADIFRKPCLLQRYIPQFRCFSSLANNVRYSQKYAR
ncbi:hypothetical protein BGZ83_012070, partial [Gryganskiella cystojenkinii]